MADWSFAIYAGPILRRTEPNRVCVWIATSAPVRVKGEIYIAEDLRAYINGEHRSAAPPVIGKGANESIPLGKRLHITLVQITPNSKVTGQSVFPNLTLLGYDLELIPKDSKQKTGRRLIDMYFSNDLGISYPPYRFPTFFIAPFGPTNILHGSCRKLHGEGGDALAIADTIIASALNDATKRPAALFLTGDQIYADDVSDVITDYIATFAQQLLGYDERIPLLPNMSGSAPVSQLRCGIRERVLTNVITSDERRNHVLGFGEFAALYLLAWNADNWPADLPTVSRCPPGKPFSQSEIDSLNVMQKALPAVRRALANIPTYMIFDDHEVTDDWNLTRQWQDRARKSTLGKRLMANGLAAYWAFQGFGNDPDSFSDAFIKPIVDSLSSSDRPGDWEDGLLDFPGWGYVAPTNPPAIFMNTRTKRGFDSDTGPPRLLGDDEMKRVVDQAAAIMASSDVLILIAATPVIGVDTNEYLQERILVKVSSPEKYDLESWHSNVDCYYQFLRVLHTLKPRACVILSGDVHYAFARTATIANATSESDFTPITQFCSSALKNVPDAAVLVGQFGPKDQRFDMFQRSVATRLPTALLTKQYLNTPPVILDEKDARSLGVLTPIDHIERIRMVGPDADPSSRMIFRPSNLGQLLFDSSLRATLVFHVMNGTSGPVNPTPATIALDTLATR